MELHYFDLLKAVRDAGQVLLLEDLLKMEVFHFGEAKLPLDLADTQAATAPLDLPFPSVLFIVGNNLLGIVERAFNTYTFYTIRRVAAGFDIIYQNHDKTSTPSEIESYILAKLVAADFLRKMDTNRCATHDFKRPLMIKRRKKHIARETKAITFVSVNTETARFAEKATSTKLDWQLSWKVRGHWRRVKGTGKDRQGVRCVDNYTWVKPAVKGKGPLKTTIRLVKND